MNTMWSSRVQGIQTLDQSRMLRFSEAMRETYKALFKLDAPRDILEIGCGTGALCRALARWYSGAAVTGLDRDSAFVAYARAQGGARYIEGDALHLPFEDESFDVTISNTVLEHVEPTAFFAEQRRVLRPGGVCLVLSARRGIAQAAPCMREESAFEREIWARLEQAMRDNLTDCGIGCYAMNEAEMPACMAQNGFEAVETGYLTVNLTPDNPHCDRQTALDMIEANRVSELEGVHHAERVAGELLAPQEADELKRHINARYDKRRALYELGQKQWDVNLALTMVVRGVRPL